MRSLISAIRVRKERHGTTNRKIVPASTARVVFTKEMRKTYTVLCPQMSPIHFKMLEAAFNASDYNLVVLPNDNKKSVDVGLKYVNNDACYPSLMVVGQVMEALLSGKYDLNHTAVLMSQTGGGCRALKLRRIYPPRAEKGRHGADSGHLDQLKRTRELIRASRSATLW